MEQNQESILFEKLLNKKKTATLIGPKIFLGDFSGLSFDDKWLELVLKAVNIMEITDKPVFIISRVIRAQFYDEANTDKVIKELLKRIRETLEMILPESKDPVRDDVEYNSFFQIDTEVFSICIEPPDKIA